MQYSTRRLFIRFTAVLSGFCCFFGAALSLRADEGTVSFLNDWYWHAFFSQGFVYTSDNNFAGPSDDSVSAEFSELGLIVGGQLFDNVQVVAQVLSRNMGEMSDGGLQLDYGFLSYQFLSDWDRSLGVKVGRVRSPLGFFNETRDVAHTRTSILLPQSIYMDRLRNLVFARDGIQLFGDIQFGSSLLSWDLVYAEIQINEEYLPEVVGGQDLPGKVDAPYLPMARVIWDWDAGRTRLGLTYHPLKYRYKAAATDLYSSGTVEFENWILSAEYNTADWTLIGEYSFGRNKLSGLLDSLPVSLSFNSQTRGYYVQGIYRFAPGWDGFVRYDEERVKFNSASLQDIRTQAISIGLGWQPSPRWLLRGEWHRLNGDTWLSARENVLEQSKQRWQMVLFQVSYRL